MEDKIVIYSLGLVVDLIIGEPKEFSVEEFADVAFTVERFRLFGVPCPGFAFLTELSANREDLLQGAQTDAFILHEPARLYARAPLSPQNPAKVIGSYSGFVPREYRKGARMTLVAQFEGPLVEARS